MATRTTTVPGAVAVPVNDPHQREAVVVRDGFPLRSIIYMGLGVLCGVLAIAGVATVLFSAELAIQGLVVKSTTSLWRSCRNDVCADLDDGASGCAYERIKAMRAFGIMAILWAFLVCIPLGVADMLRKLPTLRHANLVLASAAAVLMSFLLIYWALAAGLWNRGCGDVGAFKDVQGSEYGPSAPLFIAAWIISLGMMVLPLLLHAHCPEEKTVPAHHHAVANATAIRPAAGEPAVYPATTRAPM